MGLEKVIRFVKTAFEYEWVFKSMVDKGKLSHGDRSDGKTTLAFVWR